MKCAVATQIKRRSIGLVKRARFLPTEPLVGWSAVMIADCADDVVVGPSLVLAIDKTVLSGSSLRQSLVSLGQL